MYTDDKRYEDTKQAGLWRGKFDPLRDKPTHCPSRECRRNNPERSLSYDLLPIDDDYAGALADAYEVDDWDDRFVYIRVLAVCDHCSSAVAYGPRYFWNEDSGNYDFPAPVMPDVARRMEAEHERQAAIRAGQLTLFDGE